MTKVLIILNKVQKYRIPIYNLLNNYVDLTIAHSHEIIDDKNLLFKQRVLPTKTVKGFIFHNKELLKVCSEYDVILALSNLRCIDLMRLAFIRNRGFKLIYWGIGVSASTANRKIYDEDKKLDFLRKAIFRRANANIFYCDYPIRKYMDMGFKSETLFVANNTIPVFFDEIKSYDRNSYLFVGTLYKNKGIGFLLDAYSKASKLEPNIPILNIIGDGSEFVNIQEYITVNGLTEKVFLKGAIYDESILHDYFRSALVTISPNQAGLSVLSSLGHGTPFITYRNAITGGERFNILTGENGIIYDNHSELPDILIDIYRFPLKYITMGINAREYYLQNRKPEMMVNGIMNAVRYVIK